MLWWPLPYGAQVIYTVHSSHSPLLISYCPPGLACQVLGQGSTEISRDKHVNLSLQQRERCVKRGRNQMWWEQWRSPDREQKEVQKRLMENDTWTDLKKKVFESRVEVWKQWTKKAGRLLCKGTQWWYGLGDECDCSMDWKQKWAREVEGRPACHLSNEPYHEIRISSWRIWETCE